MGWLCTQSGDWGLAMALRLLVLALVLWCRSPRSPKVSQLHKLASTHKHTSLTLQ